MTELSWIETDSARIPVPGVEDGAFQCVTLGPGEREAGIVIVGLDDADDDAVGFETEGAEEEGRSALLWRSGRRTSLGCLNPRFLAIAQTAGSMVVQRRRKETSGVTIRRVPVGISRSR